MPKSTRNGAARKAGDRPKKPYPDFPLTPHASGAWQKKIRGKIHYFGKWGRRVNGKLERIPGDGWEAALALYKAQADDLHAGRTPRVKGDGLTVADLCNRFRTAKLRKAEAREIGPRTYAEYTKTTDRLVRTFGGSRLVEDLAADDFEALRADLAKQFGPVRLGNEITRVKTVFKYATDNGLLDRQVQFGSEFKKPGKAVLRKHKASSGGNMMEADELRKLLDAAPTQLKAMLLLMVNCGFGPMDCATLPLSAVDLDAGWIDYPRPKTGIARRCPLWPETVAALRAAIPVRPAPRQDGAEKLVFLTARGRPCISGNIANPITLAVTGLMKKVEVHREGRGAYTLRHVFRTIADGALDRVAIDLIMGHSDPSMGGQYRERVDDSRLTTVAEHVRTWVFGDDGGGPAGKGSTVQEKYETCGPSEPGSDAEDSDGPQSTQPGGPVLTAAGRPTLRLYAV
jgi:integrase